MQRFGGLNTELEEALNRRNAAMNAMFSAWLAEQLPTNIRNSDGRITNLNIGCRGPSDKPPTDPLNSLFQMTFFFYA